ncbi:MAG: hypothetical protein ACR2NC_03460 [Thermodesulfobacteriota bacterium]
MELRKSRIALAALLVLVLIIYLFISKIYIPGLVEREVANFSEQKGVELSLRTSSFDLFRGLILKDAKLGNSVSVTEIAVRPSYLASLRSRSLTINSLFLEGPEVKIDDELPENIIKIRSPDSEKDEQKSNIEIKNIDIDNLVINAGSATYSIRELDIELPGDKAKGNRVNLHGRIENDSFRQKIEFLSAIEIKENRQLEIELTVPELNKGELTDFLKLPFDLSVILNTVVDYNKGLNATGKFVINNGEKAEIGGFSFDAGHNKENKYLSINSIKGGIGDILRIDMKGRAGNMKDNLLLDLSGVLDIPEARVLEPWFPFLEKVKLSGSYIADEILIKKHEDETTVVTSLDAGNFRIEFGEYNVLTASKLSTGKYLNFVFKRDEGINSYFIGSEDVNYSGFNYLDYASQGGVIKSFNFNYKQDVWDVELTSSGESVINQSLNAMLTDYLLNLSISNKKGVEINGDIKGVDGYYGNFSLLTFFTNFNFSNTKINFDKLEAGIENYGDIFVDNGSLLSPLAGGGEYLLELNDSKFVYTDPNINSENIKGLFTINGSEDGSNIIEGRLFAEKAYIYGSEISNLNLDYYSLGNSYKISNIKGEFSGGKLGGNLNFLTKGDEISYDSTIRITGAGNKSIKAGTVNLESKGVYSKGLFSDAEGKIEFTDLYFGAGYTEAAFYGELEIKANPETISIDKGFISNAKGKRFTFTGGLNNYSGENSNFKLNAPEIPLDFLIDVFSAYLPENTFVLDVAGSVAVDFDALNFLSETEVWNGTVKIDNSTLSAFINDAEVLIEDLEGSITIREIVETENRLVGLLGTNLTISREVFQKYLEQIKNDAGIKTRDYLKVGKLKYGFFEMDNIEAKFEMDNDELNLLFLKSDVYEGNLYASGLMNFGNEKELYNISLLFSDLSLKSISDSLPSMQGYITGVVDGLLWFTVGNSYTSINGPFAFWAKDSKNEKRTIGRALLEKIGAKGRFFTGSSRKYDKGEISGYIKDGFITFKKLIISNKIFGYTDLKIEADKKRNSITVKHLLSVIRELARRASRGDIEIDYQ